MSSPVPSSVLIVGSGLFGLTTASTLSTHPLFRQTKITVVERHPFPAPDAASIDSSRIIRADYADAIYANLMAQAARRWRNEDGRAEAESLGGEGRYTQSGLCIVLSEDKGESGTAYMEKSYANVRDWLGLREGRDRVADGAELTFLRSGAEIGEVVRNSHGGELGCRGYVNWTSGWADAERCMRFLRREVERQGRVQFRTARVERLLFDHASSTVKGVELAGGGEKLEAELVVVAAGAWSPALVDLRGVASATGQAMAYVHLTPEEQAELGENPTLLDESTGCFIITPRDGVLKVARHGYGYANPNAIPHPERPQSSGEKINVSLPLTATIDPALTIPPEAQRMLRDFLARCFPRLAEREFFHTRLCWYTDSPSGDWVVDFHSRWKGLFVATAGSGHAFKFLPVLGERVVEIIVHGLGLEGHDEVQHVDELGRKLRQRWAWPSDEVTAKRTEHVWTDDWRGGRKGMVLEEEMAG